MPYIGNTSPSRFVSNRAASVYSGDGSTTAFTLEQAVVQDEDILVSVDGVVQEPSVAYAVSNGTTLTFTAAPSSNAGNNIFVYYLASQVGTVGHPSNQALSATSGTFSGAVTINDGDAGSVTANTVADELVVESNGAGGLSILTPDASDAQVLLGGPGTNAGAILRWNDNANLMSMGTNNSGGTLALKIGNFTDALTIDANGHVNKPLQPAFLVQPASTQSGISNNTTLAFGTEIFDQNADFASNTFTAPVTGRYHISYSLYFEDVRSDLTALYVTTKLSNREMYVILDPQSYDQTLSNLSLHFSMLVDMDANDTAYLIYFQAGGGDNTNLNTNSYFSGYLVA